MKVKVTAKRGGSQRCHNKADAKAVAEDYRSTAFYSWNITSLSTPCDTFFFTLT